LTQTTGIGVIVVVLLPSSTSAIVILGAGGSRTMMDKYHFELIDGFVWRYGGVADFDLTAKPLGTATAFSHMCRVNRICHGSYVGIGLAKIAR
jgi:hypothetical protein